MNRSGYVIRPIDQIDKAIIAALTEDGRMAIKDVAGIIDMSSPSITARIDKLKDAGAILGYSVLVDPKIFGLSIAAHVRLHAMPGEASRVERLLKETPQVVEADQVTGEDCFVAKFVVKDVDELRTVTARFQPFAATDVAIVQSSPVAKRLPRL